MATSVPVPIAVLSAVLIATCWTASCNQLIPVGEDGYYMVFRVQPGIGQSAYHRYMQANNNDDDDGMMMDLALPCGCKTTDGRGHCDRHFRSRLLDKWTSLPIDNVRVGIYKDNVEVHYLLFNGRGSKFNDWFSDSRLLSSSYKDVKSAGKNFFSIAGNSDRRFFINHKYGGCPQDSGWLVVVDKEDPPCANEWAEHGPFPTILYSPFPRLTRYAAEVAVADALVISVKMLPDTCPPSVTACPAYGPCSSSGNSCPFFCN